MARGSGNSAPSPAAISLPKVEFEISNDEVFKLPAGVHEQQARSYGYNDYSEFQRPDYYIRHIEPLESDLAKTVEYDMDEQDQEWLDAVNVDRKGRDHIDKVSCEVFEIIMDRLEKEWFDLTKNIPKADFAMPSEDSTCAICDDSEGENANAIVFCDGCNLAVHQDCYGVPYIPEGQWLCRKCTVSPENPVSCVVCPNEGGAFKQTVSGEWIHLLCAIWLPETRVANEVFMEPITGADRITKQRWKLRCTICDIREGACIQCAKSSCFAAFHATCARKEKFLMPMKSAQGAEPASLKCYCDKHLPQEQQDARTAALEAEEAQERMAPNHQLATKSARAYAKTYKPGPPLVPAIVVDRIMAYIYRIKVRKKPEFVHQVCRYWSLKREARRGAPLLKRLHLEPWTANAGTKVLSEEEKLMRLEQLQRLRQDLLVLQELTDLVRKRETRKLRQAEVAYEVMSEALFRHHGPLRHAFERIMTFDRQEHFKNPVSRHEVPDYFDVIKKPMCWDVIDSNLDQHKYWDLQSFLDDVNLVLDNALLYNKAGSVFHKTATRIKKDSRPVLADLEKLRLDHSHPIVRTNGIDPSEAEEEEKKPETADEPSLPVIGDLEPHMEILDLMFSSDAIKEDLNIELDDSPMASLLNYEFARVKPPPPDPPPEQQRPPPPPRTSKAKKAKQKRDRKAEAERAKANREAREAAARVVNEDAGSAGISDDMVKDEARVDDEERDIQAALDSSAGFRAPKTRNARAAAAAFEAEAHGFTAGPSMPPEFAFQKPISKSKKRLSVAPISQPSVPRVVSDVGNRDSFNMFHAGWILPPDQKRGGRAPASQQTLPPPKKRQKTDHPNSRLSVVSTAASDNQTLRKTPPWSSDSLELKHNPDDVEEIPMDVDHFPTDQARGGGSGVHYSEPHAASSPGNIDAPHNVVELSNGTIVIEKLDTPATRREKSLRRKAERQKLAALTLETGLNASTGSGAQFDNYGAGPSKTRAASTGVYDDERDAQGEDDENNESELSELSEEDSEEADMEHKEEEVDVSASTRSKSKLQPRKSGRSRKKVKAEQFEGSTIVWAKSDSFPWWPAIVYSETSGTVPANIQAAHKQKKQKRKIKLYIVQYYDKQNSWQSVARDKLMLLGEDKKLDEELLGTTPKQKWKGSASRSDCRFAYRRARAAMDGASASDVADTGDKDGESQAES